MDVDRSKAYIDALMRRVRALMEVLRPQDVINIVSAMARLDLSEDDLAASLLELFAPGVFSPEECLRFTWAAWRLRRSWAEALLLPRYVHAPHDLAEKVHYRAAALPGERLGDGRVPIVLCRGFATRDECMRLRRIAERRGWTRTGNEVRTAHVAVLDRRGSADDPLVAALRKRAASLLGLSAGHCEPIQVVRHGEDDAHQEHFDYVREQDVRFAMDREEPTSNSLLLGGQRLATVLLYLTGLERFEGGETYFEHLGVRVRPEVGAALVWPNVDRDGLPAPLTKHASLCLEAEENLVANLWLRTEDLEAFRAPGSLGSRITGPPWQGATPPLGDH